MSDSRHKKILQKKRLYLKDNLVLKGTRVLDQLFQDSVLNHEQLARMDSQTKENEDRVSDLLSLLYTRPYEDWEKFLKALSEHNQEHVVKELLVFEGDKPDATFELVRRTFARKIRDRCGKVEIWTPQGEPECVPMDKIFIDVHLETSNQMMTGYKDICGQFTQASTIHIFGEPNTGKSTLSTRLCFDWASMHARGSNTKQTLSSELDNLKFVLPVYVKDVKEGHTILDFVVDSCGLEWEEAEAVCRYIKQNQESTLFVIDGLDEYDTMPEDMTNILQRKMYPGVKMLITSRNTAVEDKESGKCVPDLELTLYGLSDDGVQEFVKKMCKSEADVGASLLEYIQESDFMEHMSHYPAFLLLMINLWQNTIFGEKTFFYHFFAYVIDQSRRKQNGIQLVRKSPDRILEENHHLIMGLGKLASTGVKKDRMDKEFQSAEVFKHVKRCDLKFGFLLKKRNEEGQYVYQFVHKAIQDMLLSYFLGNISNTEQLLDLALTFYECQRAIIGCNISRLTSFVTDSSTRAFIEPLFSGKEEVLAEPHTNLQLQSLQHDANTDLVLPKVTYLYIHGLNREQVTKYLSKDGSRLEKLAVRSDEKYLCFLSKLTAPNLNCLILLNSAEIIHEVEEREIDMITPAIVKFRLKTLDMRCLYRFSEPAKSAVVQAACQIETLECLSFTGFTPPAADLHKLANWLPKSNLRKLALFKCGLNLEQLLEIIDVLPLCSALVNLDVSKNNVKFGVEKLVNKTEKFRRLQKLNLSFNLIPAEIKQQIKERIQCYPELELEIEKQSDIDG